jgi:hypothetical protein
VVFWICANSIWMIGEFFYDDHTRHGATVFFVLGLLCVAWYYLVARPFWRGPRLTPVADRRLMPSNSISRLRLQYSRAFPVHATLIVPSWLV